MLTVEPCGAAPSATSQVLKAFNDAAAARDWPFTCAPATGFLRPELEQALATWIAAAKGRAMPARADMTARIMKPFLANMSLIERVETDCGARYRVRLHGSRLASYDGDSTGKFLEEVVRDGRIEGYRALYDTFLAWCAPLRVISHYQAPKLDYLVGETLLAPLAVPESATPLILSVTYIKPRLEDESASARDSHA